MKTGFGLKFLLSFTVCCFSFYNGGCQSADLFNEKFTAIKKIETTPVKNQYISITCWSFAVISMLKSDLMQTGQGKIDLSEMYIVYNAYIEKAERFIRMHGNINFGGGGELNDPIDIIRKYGIVPNEAYNGLIAGNLNYNHIEMDNKLKDYVVSLVKKENIAPDWKNGFVAILNNFMGKPPDEFSYNNKKYTPVSYAKSLGIDLGNYILFTSFTHHPYYQKFIFEAPDNWSWGMAYNLPLDEFKHVIDYILDNGNSLAIASDFTEKGFFKKSGFAVALNEAGYDNDKSAMPGKKNTENDTGKFSIPEVNVTPQLRQEAFDNYETTDNHDFHLVGTARDQNNKKFYIAKNSWGTEGLNYGGFFYLSEPYLLYKTLTILVNKKYLPSDILNKPGIQ